MEETFIAYLGSEISRDELKSYLNSIADKDCVVKTWQEGEALFGKIVIDNYVSDRDPQTDGDLLVVSGCDRKEISRVIKKGPYKTFDPEDYDRNWRLFSRAYRSMGLKLFEYIEPDLDFSVAIYDRQKKEFIAGRGNGEVGKEANLFYGYTKNNGDIMFSNNKKALLHFCDTVSVFPVGSYYINDTIHSYLEPDKKDIREPKLIKENQSNANQLITGLNDLLAQVATDAVKGRIEDEIDAYFGSSEPKEKIESLLQDSIENETRDFVTGLVQSKLNDIGIESIIKTQLRRKYMAELKQYIKTQQIPYVNVIKLKDTVIGKTGVECFHEKFEEVLEDIQFNEPVMLIGPAGSGKNHSIAQIARALGLNMYYTNNASNEFKLTGFIDAGGTYRETEFYKAFKNGGIFFLDEIDNSDPSALIVINSALANGYMAFPHETIFSHPNFRMVAAANTWGKGSDLQYVGRNALDGATLDRFDNIYFDYDRRLEETLYPNHDVLDFMWAFRDSVESTKTPHIVSTRGIGKVYKKEINGVPVERILRTNIVRNLDQDDLNSILGNMNNIRADNKYFSAAKSLKIGK